MQTLCRVEEEAVALGIGRGQLVQKLAVQFGRRPCPSKACVRVLDVMSVG
jgi:hypothetical protein